MIDNDDVPHAGCVGTPEAAAGCVQATGDDSQAAASPVAESAGAGCAASSPPADGSTQATPPTTVREFEHALRALGFTRLQAAHIARQGFSGVTAHAAPEPESGDTDQLREALQKLARSLESSS